MPRFSPDHVPTYRLHKRSGQAIVTLAGQDHYLGRHGTQDSRQKYRRLITSWFEGGAKAAVQSALLPPPDDCGPVVDQVIAAFWRHAERYYRDKEGHPTAELASFRDVLRVLHDMHGATDASKFGPLCLQACQTEMVRNGLSRKTINRRVVRIRHVFKWAVSQEMLPAGVYQGLGTVAGLKRGRSDAKELAAVRPVTETHVRAVLAHASRTVATMAELQMLTGMRSGELVIMRTGDIDRASEVWAYAPAKHKTEHHGHARVVYLGRRAQELIRPFLKMDPDAYLFSPAEAEAERRAALSANRKTPLSCGNRIGTNRSPGPRKKPGEHYKVVTYARAITTACDKAFSPPPEVTNPAEIVECKKAHRFHPHQLRHTAATRFRREANIETTRVLLGQKTLAAAEIYAELDTERAREFAARAG